MRSMWEGSRGKRVHENTVNLLLTLKMLQFSKNKTSPPSERHETHARQEYINKRPCAQSPQVICLCQGILYTSEGFPASASLPHILFLYLKGFLFLFSSKQQFTTQGLALIFFKVQPVQVLRKADFLNPAVMLVYPQGSFFLYVLALEGDR